MELQKISVVTGDPFRLSPNSFAHRALAIEASKKNRLASAQLISQIEARLPDLATREKARLRKIGENPDPETFAAELLVFGQLLESTDQPDAAGTVYSFLLEKNGSPEIQSRARRNLDALLGRGPLGGRAELLIRNFAETATDYRLIVPMLGASVVGQITHAAIGGRLAATPAAHWLSRGLGARWVASSAGLLAEVPAFASLGRILGPHSEASLGDDLKRSALTLGALRLFGWGGGKIHDRLLQKFPGWGRWANPALSRGLFSQTGVFAGLMAAHRLEEKLGLRPSVEGATLVTDTLASMVSLGVGTHFGQRALGARFRDFQQEILARESLYRDRTGFEYWQIFLEKKSGSKMSHSPALAPWMAMSSQENNGGKGPGPIVGLRGPYPSRERYHYHGLPTYRDLISQTFLGDPLKNIRERIETGKLPVRILDLGAGDGRAVQEIKERYGNKVLVETNDLEPLRGEYLDRHYTGDFLEVDFGKSYDLIFSIFGPHAYHRWQFWEMLQKAAGLLAPGGEFTAALTSDAIAGEESGVTRFASLPYILRGMDQGILIRFEPLVGGGLLYMKRLSPQSIPNLAELSKPPPPEGKTHLSSGQLEKRLLKVQFQAGEAKASLGYPMVTPLAKMWEGLDVPEIQNHPERWIHRLFGRYLSNFKRNHNRLPNAYEINQWIAGSEPSPLASQSILIDELTQLRLAERNTSFPPPKNPGPIERRRLKDLMALEEQLNGIPKAHAETHLLRKEIGSLREKAGPQMSDADFHHELAQLETKVRQTWGGFFQTTAQNLQPILHDLARWVDDPGLLTPPRVIQAMNHPSHPDPWEAQEMLLETASVLSRAVRRLAQEEWSRLSPQDFPEELGFTLAAPLAVIFSLHLEGAGFSARAIQEFVREAVEFFHAFPPEKGEFLQLTPDGEVTAHNFLLGKRPTADSYLGSIVANLRGYRQMFGEDAGWVFHRRAKLSSELKDLRGNPTGYHLVVERGQHEFENGLKLAFYHGDFRSHSSNAYLAKVGLHFGEDQTLRIVNIQGRNPNPFENSATMAELRERLGGGHPLDMLVAATLLLAKNAGYSRVEGIRDGAQIARADHSEKSGRGGFYDLFFRRFGFHPPEEGQDYWSLDLKSWEIHRKPGWNAAENGPVSPLQGLDLSLPFTPGRYFRQVLDRKTEAGTGRRTRPQDWDLQVPGAATPPVLAFWRIMAPALSSLAWQDNDRFSNTPFEPKVARPFRLKRLNEGTPSPESKFFRQALTLTNEGNPALGPESLKAFRRALHAAKRGRISGERAEGQLSQILQEDWILHLKAFGATEIRYPFQAFWDEMGEKKGGIPSWAQKIPPEMRKEPMVELILDKEAFERLLTADPENLKRLRFAEAIFALIAQNLNLPREAFQIPHGATRQTFRMPPASFFHRLPEWLQDQEAVGGEAVASLVSEDEAFAMLLKGKRPKVYSSHAQDLHEQKGIHPFIALAHDHYHLVKANRLSPDSFRETVQLAEIFRELRHWYPEMTRIPEMLMDTEIGGDPGHRTLWTFIRQQAPTAEQIEAIGKRLIERFSGSEGGRGIIQTFREVFGIGPAGSDGGAAPLLALAVGGATLLSPQTAHAADPSLTEILASSLPWDALVIGAAGLISLGFLAYHWLREKKKDEANPGENHAVPPPMEKLEAGPKAEDPAPGWVEPLGLAKGFIKLERGKLDQQLKDVRKTPDEKDTLIKAFFAKLVGSRLDQAQVLQTAAAMWDYTFDTHLNSLTQRTLFQNYLFVLENGDFFPVGSPQVYREAIRLRNILTDSREPWDRRKNALEGYFALLPKLDQRTEVGRGEAHSGIRALEELDAEIGIRAPEWTLTRRALNLLSPQSGNDPRGS